MFEFRNFGTGKVLIVAALALLTPGASLLASPIDDLVGQSASGPYRISVDVGLVILPVVVTDRKGKAVSGLGENSFKVFDDGRRQQISLFEAEDVPVTVGLVIDDSASMWTKRPEVLAAAEQFINSSNPQDQIFVVNFNQDVFFGLPQSVPFSSNAQELLNAISRMPPSGNTALYDGVAAGLDHLKAGTASRKALIVISDGGDNSSTLKLQQLLRQAQASSAQIYTLGVFDDYAGEDAGVLKRLAKVTGGEAYLPRSAAQVPEICEQIARNLRHQYTLGYQPAEANRGGQYHAIRVTAKGTGEGRLRVSTRSGYLVPSEAQKAPVTPPKESYSKAAPQSENLVATGEAWARFHP